MVYFDQWMQDGPSLIFLAGGHVVLSKDIMVIEHAKPHGYTPWA